MTENADEVFSARFRQAASSTLIPAMRRRAKTGAALVVSELTGLRSSGFFFRHQSNEVLE
uniref:Uncharacterized protein n=1 Tax=Candidatus Kentrum sp. TC TaxID=2126339 RepID=A0A450YSW5_9GAMM|nr:MAG: hypothetical protein BECKTC1821E_GA0114239_103712 [Candidatus Kentron sp. TC]